MALTKTVDGKPLPADKFAYVGDPQDISTWHLPIDSNHIKSALVMFGHETHVPSNKKAAVARKICAAAKAAGIDADNFEKKYCGTQHADFGNGFVEIFRAGDYGEKGKFTAEDLDRIVANYDPSFHEAPACVGHPKDDLPAYGWVSGLKRDGTTLLAQFREVDPAFETAVKAGRFKKRSAAFYLNGDGQIDGLRHVAFLGAQPPEVKGLSNLTFDDGGRKFTAIDAEDTVEATEKTIREQIGAFFAEMFGKKSETATATFTEADVKRIAGEAVAAATRPLTDQITALKTDLTNQGLKFGEREKAIAASETKQRAVDAVNALKSKGRWIPAFEKMGLPLLFEELAKVSGTVEFGEAAADGKKPQVAPLQVLVSFMEGLPEIVPGGVKFQGAATRTANAKNSKDDPLTVAARARQKEKGITFSEALDQVAAENPELTRAGGATAGSV